MSNFSQLSLFGDSGETNDETKSTTGKAKNKPKKQVKKKPIIEEEKKSTVVIKEVESLPTLEIPGIKVVRDAFLTHHFQQIGWGRNNPEQTTEEVLLAGCQETLEYYLLLHRHNISIPSRAILEVVEGNHKKEWLDFDAIAVRHHLVLEDKMSVTLNWGKVLIFLRPGTLQIRGEEFSICGGDLLIGQPGKSAIALFDAPVIEVSFR